MAMVRFRFTNRFPMGERKMELDLSSLSLLADTAALVSEGKLSLTPSTETQETGRTPNKTKKTGLAALIGPSELPIDCMDKIREMRGQDVMLMVEKKLTATDMSRGQSRLSVPQKQIREKFLSEEEIQILDRKVGIKVSLVEPCLEVSHGLQLKKWNYTSENFSYMFTERWNAVAHPYERNELIKDVIIQLWSFRVDGNLCFCLMKVKTPGSGKYSYS